MPAYVKRPLRSERGKFADRYTTCSGCNGPLLDAQGTGHHPTDECALPAEAQKTRAA